MGLLKEFKEFAMRGNVIDLAVGVIIGGAFGKTRNARKSDRPRIPPTTSRCLHPQSTQEREAPPQGRDEWYPLDAEIKRLSFARHPCGCRDSLVSSLSSFCGLYLRSAPHGDFERLEGTACCRRCC